MPASRPRVIVSALAFAALSGLACPGVLAQDAATRARTAPDRKSVV